MNRVQETVTITNKLGLHARAAAVFVQVASKFQSNIQLKKTDNSIKQDIATQDIAEQDIATQYFTNSLNSDWVNGKSILNVMTLDAGIGSQIVINVQGPDAQQALDRLIKLVNDKFGEKE